MPNFLSGNAKSKTRFMRWKDACAFGGNDRKEASKSEVTALYTGNGSPLETEWPYHTFARCPPTHMFGRPAKWSGPEASSTQARLLWDRNCLYLCYELEGAAREPLGRSSYEAPDLQAWLEDKGIVGMSPEQRAITLDERVECFIWQPKQAIAGASMQSDSAYDGETYHAFEINFAGEALTMKSSFGTVGGFDWDGSGAYRIRMEELALGWATGAAPVPGAPVVGRPKKRVVLVEFKWAALGIDIDREIRIGLHRIEYPDNVDWTAEKKGTKEQVSTLMSNMILSSWVDPSDDVANLHRPALFGKLALAPQGADIDCSCFAARFTANRQLGLVNSPIPTLAQCPPGSLLVQTKYASLCGSDLPYFREGRKPSCYWDRDGFAGHEVVGIVLESKSDKYKPGDHVLALPSNYFKAHTSAKPEWYKEEIHGVLLENMPVRGAFSEVYTSHEVYTTKIKECTPEVLCAQGLGCILKLARRTGSVLGKTVAILGQGQNGLLATRLMSQFCAKEVIGIDPIEFRREASLKCGATAVASPEEAHALVMKLTNGRGADIVLEMVGHNQQTVNDCLSLCKIGGIVTCFGVPDDQQYQDFGYGLFFRKNITMIATVFPDPQEDFPEAVKLIEEGRFSTAGLLTHTLPLSRVNEAFEISSDYKDGVVKLVIDFSKE
mmetsp:Transcript_50848/g.107947  ORF Transcript_50848/g.107947 Transcript_50848/m.107947 type:complete len:665 (+) Transcript_50848:204-2198(+)|eukprot:CAMPEP_0206426656 /NCGR_PEP_ID=MMETSP0324_2-20121206/4507_1 /ASSEMBLY_ACC=CAM_ASM_000836 /TAXON_ID=2866 /ORGANISM="Crypthecodinium cohnii, Strain Seligo" /LENGTH=664 /DNA_ID=CAMNT_0053891651 /DNA_START=199 /DNA_END=2193 /DNA_ORIENTATION=-